MDWKIRIASTGEVLTPGELAKKFPLPAVVPPFEVVHTNCGGVIEKQGTLRTCRKCEETEDVSKRQDRSGIRRI